jgi:hypothetical protein
MGVDFNPLLPLHGSFGVTHSIVERRLLEDAEDRAQLREAWLAWLVRRRIPWEVYGHLTFDGGRMNFIEAEKTWRRFVNALARTLKPLSRRHARDRLLWIRAVERHHEGGAHIHFVAAAPRGLPALDPRRLGRLWDSVGPLTGNYRIDPFDSIRAQAAQVYLLKGAGLGASILPSDAAAKFVPSDA